MQEALDICRVYLLHLAMLEELPPNARAHQFNETFSDAFIMVLRLVSHKYPHSLTTLSLRAQSCQPINGDEICHRKSRKLVARNEIKGTIGAFTTSTPS